MKTYCLVQDEDCHWYIIHSEKKQEWNKFFEDPEYLYKDLPEWAKRVDSPSNVHFMNYTED